MRRSRSVMAACIPLSILPLLTSPASEGRTAEVILQGGMPHCGNDVLFISRQVMLSVGAASAATERQALHQSRG